MFCIKTAANGLQNQYRSIMELSCKGTVTADPWLSSNLKFMLSASQASQERSLECGTQNCAFSASMSRLLHQTCWAKLSAHLW